MKILHAAETIKGGVATVLCLLLVSPPAGTFSTVVLVPAEQVNELAPATPTRLETFHRSGRNIASLLRFSLKFAALVWQEKPDVVHLHSSLAGFTGRAVLLVMWPLRRPRVVYCPHGWSFDMNVSPLKKRIYALMERLLLPLTDAAICISAFEKTSAAAMGLPVAKLHVIHNGVPVQAEQPKNPYASGKTNVLFVGRFDRQKGFDILLDAMELVNRPDLHLTAIGAPVLAEETPPTRANISYTGWLKPQDVLAYYAHADVLIVPSRWEGFGLVAAEAMSCGTPVVASRAGGLPELVDDGVTGRLCELTATELAAILNETPLKDWRAMRPATRERHARHFDSRRMIDAQYALYHNGLTG